MRSRLIEERQGRVAGLLCLGMLIAVCGPAPRATPQGLELRPLEPGQLPPGLADALLEAKTRQLESRAEAKHRRGKASDHETRDPGHGAKTAPKERPPRAIVAPAADRGRGGGVDDCDACLAGTIECGGAVKGALAPGDCTTDTGEFADVWRLEVPSGLEVEIRLTSPGFDAFLALRDADCNEIVANDDCEPGNFDSCLILGLGQGTYDLVATSFAANETGAYNLAVECVENPFCSDCLVGALDCGDSTTGTLSEGDCVDSRNSYTDVYRVEIAQAGEYSFTMESGPIDTWLSLFDSGCLFMARNDDCNQSVDRSCLVANLRAGTYFLAASSFADLETGPYSISACDPGPCRECVVDSIDCGESLEGTLAAGDCVDDRNSFSDYYRLEIDAPGTYTFTMESAPVDTWLSLFDTNCALIDNNDDCGGSLDQSCLTATLDAGTYFLLASSFSDFDFKDGAGPYTITACDPGPCGDCEVERISCGAPQDRALPRGSCTRAGGQSEDILSFELEAAGPVVISLTSSDFDAFVSLYDSSCRLLGTNDDCRPPALDSCLTVEGLDAGVYFVGVSTFEDGESGTYTIEVTCPDLSFCRDCSVGTVMCGDAVNGSLTAESCTLADGTAIDLWNFQVTTAIDVTASARFAQPGDARLTILLLDDFCQVSPLGRACEPAADGCLRLRQLPPGEYFIGVNAAENGPGGDYELRLNCAPFDVCASCEAGSIRCGERIGGDLATGDCSMGDGSFYDAWSLTLDEPTRVYVDQSSDAIDSFLLLVDANCSAVATRNDCPPGGVAVIGDEILVGNFAPGVEIYDRGGAHLRTLPLPYPVSGLGGDGAGDRLFAIPLDASGSIVELDPTNGDEIRRFAAPENAGTDGTDGLAFNGSSLFFTYGSGADTIYEIDPDTGEVTDSDPIVGGSGNYNGLASLGNAVYILDFDIDRILVFDTETDSVVRTLIAPGNVSGGIAGIGDPDALLVAGPGRLYEIDAATGSKSASFALERALDSCVAETLPAGQYYLLANSVNAEEGPYNLEVGCASPDASFCAEDCRVGSILCNETVGGTLLAGTCTFDNGAFIEIRELTLPRDATVTIDLRSVPIDPFLVLYSESCVVIATNDDCKPQNFDRSCLSLELTAGTYYVGVTSFGAGETGDYTLEVTCPEVIACPDCRVGAITCGQSVEGDLPASGCTDPGGGFVDFWQLDLGRATDVSLNLESRSANYDPLLIVADADCTPIATNDDCAAAGGGGGGDPSLDSCLDISLPAGTYFVGVSSVFSDHRGPYTLTASCADEARFVRGDVDQDGTITLTDGVATLRHLFASRTLRCRDAADADDVNQLNLTDGVFIFLYLFAQGNRPPPPSPESTRASASECGVDPTPDSLDCLQPPNYCN